MKMLKMELEKVGTLVTRPQCPLESFLAPWTILFTRFFTTNRSDSLHFFSPTPLSSPSRLAIPQTTPFTTILYQPLLSSSIIIFLSRGLTLFYVTQSLYLVTKKEVEENKKRKRNKKKSRRMKFSIFKWSLLESKKGERRRRRRIEDWSVIYSS